MKTRAEKPGLRKGDSSSTSLRRANFASIRASFRVPSDLIRPIPSQKINLPNQPIIYFAHDRTPGSCPVAPNSGHIGPFRAKHVWGEAFQTATLLSLGCSELHLIEVNPGRGAEPAFRIILCHSESTPVVPDRARSCKVTLDVGLWALDSGNYQLPSPCSLIAYWAFPVTAPKRSEAGDGKETVLSFSHVRGGLSRRSAAKADHKNIENNPVFRGMLCSGGL
jgi:hypothetical protein